MVPSQIVLGTQNEGKLAELRALVGDKLEVLGLADVQSGAPEVVEDGASYRENAQKKAIAYQAWAKLPVVADDSGLEVDVLGGAPGLYSARYGGENLSWPERWAYLLEQLRPFPEKKWTAHFRCVLCFFDGAEQPVFFEGTTSGRILPSPRGKKGFGYDPIVFSDALGMTFAEASEAEKNRVSHRAKALSLLRAWLEKQGRLNRGT